MEIVEKFLYQKPTSMLFHYTNAEGLIGILRTRKIWATSHLHLNDNREFQIAAQMISEGFEERHRSDWKRFILKSTAQALVVSFSEQGDLLSQWRGYCPNGQGYSLGFKPDNLIFTLIAAQKSFGLVKCEYEKEKQERLCQILASAHKDFKDRMAGNEHQTSQFFEEYNWQYCLYLLNASLKHSGFKEEQEWRLVSQYPQDLALCFRSGRYGVTPYHEFPLDDSGLVEQQKGKQRLKLGYEPISDYEALTSMTGEGPMIDRIIIGPTAKKQAAKDALRRALETFKCEKTEISFSDIPFRA